MQPSFQLPKSFPSSQRYYKSSFWHPKWWLIWSNKSVSFPGYNSLVFQWLSGNVSPPPGGKSSSSSSQQSWCWSWRNQEHLRQLRAPWGPGGRDRRPQQERRRIDLHLLLRGQRHDPLHVGHQVAGVWDIQWCGEPCQYDPGDTKQSSAETYLQTQRSWTSGLSPVQGTLKHKSQTEKDCS